MIRKLSSGLVLAVLLLVSAASNGWAQFPATITTNYSPAANLSAYVGSPSMPMFILFRVTNNNTFPITITGVGNHHLGDFFVPAFGRNTSQNGATYTLWGADWTNATANGTGAANIVLPNWLICGQSAGTVSSATNGIISVIAGADGYIPPNTTRRFALVLTDTIWAFGNTNPTTFTSNNVTLDVQTGAFAGTMPSTNYNMVIGATNYGFDGFITFDKAAPPPPTVTPNPVIICPGAIATIKASSASYITTPVYTWYNPAGTNVQSGTSNTLNIGPATTSMSGTWTVTVYDGSKTSNPTPFSVTVDSPKAPQIDGKVDYCLNENFTPVNVITSAPGNVVKWYYTQTGGSAIPFTPYFNTTTAHTDEYWVSQTTAAGCESDRTQVPYRAAPKPSVPLVTTPIIYCENATPAQLTANGQKPLYWWYDKTGGISSQIAPTPNTTKQNTFNYYVSQKVDGCMSDRAQIDVIVTFRPNGLILPSRTLICQGDTMQLGYYGSAFPGSAYNWSFPKGVTILGGVASTPITLRIDSPGVNNLTLQVGQKGCYSPTYSQEIKVQRQPTAVIEARDFMCQGQTELVSLSYYTPTIDSFIWDWDGGETTHYSTDQGPYGVIWNTPGQKNIKLRLVEGICHITVVQDTPTVNPHPDATFTLSGNMPYCSDDSVLISANTVLSSVKYSWTPARFFDTYSDLPVAWAHLDYQDSSYIKLTVTDAYNCTYTEKQKILTKPCCDMTFPTAFTPNADGHNDIFRPITKGHQELRTLKILNRWGQVVYESLNEQKGWDGNTNGKPQEMGSYFYFVDYKCNGKTTSQKGEFILIR
ncbi:MAG: gliding motility-associated C-terminal domain-containing protein [Bacteroidetes bacterium]|nr:gliding motility-associated C-terminal domain-containing protein [Bacteroidota bacterium]